MHVNDHLSITAPLEDKKHAGERANRLDGEPLQALSQPLPFSLRIRNGLSLLLLLASVAWFWQPLVTLFSLTQQQEQYSHIVLIPCVSLYALYILTRKAIFALREWSPWLGSLVIGMGTWCYWSADAAIFAPDQLSMTILALVVMWWGIVVSCFGTTDAWGGFVIATQYPTQKVFFDDRYDTPSRSTTRTTTLLRLEPGWQKQLQQYGIDVIVWPKAAPLVQALQLDKDWTQVHADKLAVVYVRRPSASS